VNARIDVLDLGTSARENVRMEGTAVDITEQILGAAIAVHRALGPGLLESTYEACLAFELLDRGLAIVRQAALPVVYRGVRIDCGYRLDLVVEGRVIVEIKAVERVLPVHEAQILTYLKLSELPVALLLNFNVPLMKDGIKRFVGHPAA
jgi:GxxExxY protein